MLKTQTTFPLRDADTVIAKVCSHLTEHAGILSRDNDDYVIAFDKGLATLSARDGLVQLSAQAPDINGLHYVRLALASHIVEFAGTPRPKLAWTGDGADLKTPPNFRILEVVETGWVTLHMRRITFTAPDLAPFVGDDNLHVGLMLPDPLTGRCDWPTLSSDGLIEWLEGAVRPVRRKYTIRSADLVAEQITIDFVDHTDAGPASSWAAAAKPGDKIGMAGPGGLGIKPSDWTLLIGDETGLPAIGRILESLPATARGLALIEVADAAEEQILTPPPEFDIRWLHRNGAAAGTTSLLIDAVKVVDVPKDDKIFVWAGVEFEAFKAIRSYVRADLALPTAQHLVVAYWRRGQEEGA